jgi:lysophospholipase L1-like esterase
VRARLLLAAPVAAAVATAAVLAAQANVARRRDYVPDPQFDIDELVPGDSPVIRLAVLGDSTVAGLGVDHVDDSLPVQIARRIAGATGRAVQVVGHGISGARVEHLLDGQLTNVRDADALVIEIGSNDVVHATPLGVLERELEQLLLAARAAVDVVVLGGAGRLDTPNFLPPLRQLVVWRARAVRALQGAVARRTDCSFVDIGGDVAERFARVDGHTSWDGFHPAAAGYGVWADALAAQVVARLPAAEVSSPA